MKFSVLTIAACAGSALAAPQIIPGGGVEGVLKQIPAILDALQGGAGNTTAVPLRARSMAAANDMAAANEMAAAQGSPIDISAVLQHVPEILEALEDSTKNSTVAGARVGRATTTSGVDISSVLGQVPGILSALKGGAPVPGQVPAPAPVPGNATNPVTPSAPSSGGLEGIAGQLPGIITALQGVQ